MIEGAGVELACAVHGDGAPVLLVHDMAADARRWDAIGQALAAAGAQPIAYDRRGYGASGAPEPYERTTVQEQAADARLVLEATAGDGGALACGEGFGALVVLDLLVRMPGLLRGAVLLEPPLHQFSELATEALSNARVALEQALRAEGPAAAVAAWRPDADATVLGAHRAFFADFAGLASWPVTRRELRRIAVPVAIVTGPETPAHLADEADALSALVPDARRTTDGDPLAPLQSLLAAG
jgi:pimeloyl-ACP methyl ester carboxylesterase